MKIPPSIIDNSKNNLRDFLIYIFKDSSQNNLDIATAFFRIDAYGMIEESMVGIKKFRLLLGKSPEQNTEATLGSVISNMMKKEVEQFPLESEPLSLVQRFIQFLKKDSVQVRIYDKQFLHGKTYITDQLVVVGSSNFTPAGLTGNTELNLVGLESQAKYIREEWFDKFWNEALNYKEELITLLENSRFGSKEYSPYEIYLKALFELQRHDIEEMEKSEDPQIFKPVSKVNLAEFQEDAVHRIMSRLKKYGAALVADSVGLGKTWIAKKVIEEFGFYKRRKFLIVCPAQLRGMWEKEVKDLILSPFIISQEELAAPDFLQKANLVLKSGLEDVSLMVIDESHNFRNPLSNRWENCFSLLENIEQKNGKSPFVLLLTATPINNTLWDLYWQIMLMTLMKKELFLKDGIEDILKHFKRVERQDNPELLGDILNEISIRRTRDYIKRNYPEAAIEGKPILFPQRVLENIEYRLDEAFSGMYKSISHAITDELTMAYYRILEFKKTEQLTSDEQFALGRMIALEGIFRTILLKRLESSVEAFRISVQRHIDFLLTLKKYLENGKVLTKKFFQKYVINQNEEIPEEIAAELQDFNKDSYRFMDLMTSIEKDIDLCKNKLLKPVENILPENDAKLKKLLEILPSMLSKSKVVLFTYYADTLAYIFKNIQKSSLAKTYHFAQIHGAVPSKTRSKIVDSFIAGEINCLFSTDVLSEGQNLQVAQFVVNYDLHWNPTRMIQRAGRIDRIGSPFNQIFVSNFFPEEELEDLLRLVSILQDKIRNIDDSVGLDQTVLGEEVHPKVFGIIRRIKEKDNTVLDELENDIFGGGEQFYQPLRDYINKYGVDSLKNLPLGIYSGLNRGISGIFFYYLYGEDYHFWYLYDFSSQSFIKNKSEILKYLACPPPEKRIIPDFFEEIFKINKLVVMEIERTYKEHEILEKESLLKSISTTETSEKFIRKMVEELDYFINQYLFEFPEDQEIINLWDETKQKFSHVRLTKQRITFLRGIWKKYKNDQQNWKELVRNIQNFVNQAVLPESEGANLDSYNPLNLQLIVLDFIS